MSKSKKANFSIKILRIFAPVSSTFTIACIFFHPAGDATKVFVVPRKVTERMGGGDARIKNRLKRANKYRSFSSILSTL